MSEIIIAMHLTLADADKAILEAWLNGTQTLDLKELINLLMKSQSIKITTLTSASVATLSETQVYP